MKIFLFNLFSLLFLTHAYADCAGVPGKQIETKIDKISLPVYDAGGRKIKGCILHADGKVMGYTIENKLCQTVIGSHLKVRLSFGCCDTGPDDGDTECIVRAKSISGVGSAHGNGVMVHSVNQQ